MTRWEAAITQGGMVLTKRWSIGGRRIASAT
jgi:hypothetical protein